MNNAEHFFDVYAGDFTAIYDNNHRLINKVINKLLRKSMMLRYEKTISACQPIRGKTVLDVGCGPGHYSHSLVRKGATQATGVDFAANMINIANKKAQKQGIAQACHFIEGDLREFEPNQTYDYSIIMGVMDYIAQPKSFVEKVLGLTNDKAVFSFPEDGTLLALQRKLRYKKRCPLHMYTQHQLDALFSMIPNISVTIEKISRDFFVTVTKMPAGD